MDPWVGKIPWRRAWQPIPVFLLENPHGQSLEDYSPCGLIELDITEYLSTHHTQSLITILVTTMQIITFCKN